MWLKPKHGVAVPLKIRLLIVADCDAGMSHKDVSIKYGLSQATIKNYLELRDKGELAPKPQKKGIIPWYVAWGDRD